MAFAFFFASLQGLSKIGGFTWKFHLFKSVQQCFREIAHVAYTGRAQVDPRHLSAPLLAERRQPLLEVFLAKLAASANVNRVLFVVQAFVWRNGNISQHTGTEAIKLRGTFVIRSYKVNCFSFFCREMSSPNFFIIVVFFSGLHRTIQPVSSISPTGIPRRERGL